MSDTIRLSEIVSVWPPEPGPDQRTTGLKTIPGNIFGPFRETLTGLHDTAWWTGLQLLCPDAPTTEFSVRIVSDLGIDLPFGSASGMSTSWTQKAIDWQPFPWAIPASFATGMRLSLEITPIGVAADTGLWISRRLGFHELGLRVAPSGRYMFVHVNGQICSVWDEKYDAWSIKNQGYIPDGGTSYYVIPPLRDFLFKYGIWKDNSYGRLISWDHPVSII
jgi:hypothetical protein